ncbi:MAG TPA: ERCC4 domain-containing protein [Candidatus Norongarragalinales archaeon]|nr:ERCC4 domain-containing protein [Candidatus Norongarragalinales archaeon]
MELVFEKNDKVQVYCDDREENTDAVDQLKRLGVIVKSVRLDVGDFVLSDRACVERKTAADFESSVIDGRLFTQAQELKENFASPIIVIVGFDFERLHENAIRGALIALAVDYKIPAFFFHDEEDLAEFLLVLGKREQLLKPKEMKIQFSKKGSSVEQQQRLIVESLPMIGPKSALALLEHFGSVEKIVLASDKELQAVKGIGKQRAKQIRAVLSLPFK